MEESYTNTFEATLSGVISCKAIIALATSTAQIDFSYIEKKKYCTFRKIFSGEDR
jgi:hypothetical protein